MSPLYIGRPGALTAFPNLQRDYARPLTHVGGVHQLADGGLIEDRITTTRRFQVSGRWVTHTELAQLDALFLLEHRALVVIDPAQRNHLTPNQSSCSDERADPRGLSITGGDTLTSTTSVARSGTRSVVWAYTAAMGAGKALEFSSGGAFDADDPLWAVPVVPNGSYSFSAYARLGSGSMAWQAQLAWYTASGTPISTSDGTSTSVGADGWTRLVVQGATAPSNAALVIPRITNPGTPGGDGLLYVDDAQLELAPTASDWVVGRGIPWCLIEGDLESMAPLVTTGGTHHVTLTLRQAIPL